MKIKKDKIVPILALIVATLLLGKLFIDLVPLLQQVVQHAGDETIMVDFIHALGVRGVPILVGLQFLQVFIPFFPTAPVPILAGLCYGVWLGTLICLIGFVLGHSLLFYGIRKLGHTLGPFLEKKNSKLLNIKPSQKMKDPKKMVFILYFIPVIPNGMLPLVFARTNISFKKYLYSMTLASLPQILIYTLMGARISTGDYKTAVIIAGSVLVIMIPLFLFKDKIIGKISK